MEKLKFGHMQCLTPDCGTRCVVRRNAFNDTLSYSCPECGASGYAKKNESQRAAWLKRIELLPGDDPPAEVAPGPAPARGKPKPPPVPDPPAPLAVVRKNATLLG